MTDSSQQLALMIDLERCTGCKSCEAACKQTNALGPHSYRNRVMWFNEQQEPITENNLPRLDFLTVTCQQCERPACLRACPVYPKAINKDPVTGVVSVDENRCTGCGECALSCPYGAIGYNAEKHHAVKCDLCADRRKQDLGPACAFVCPTRAITFDRRENLLTKVENEQREILETDHFLQKPATIYIKRLRDEGIADTTQNSDITLIKDHHSRLNIEPKIASGSYRKLDKIKQQENDELKIIPGACHICFNGCPVKFHIRGNKVVNVYGNNDDTQFEGRICPKSQMTLQLYDNPHRLTQPLKRVGPRGSDKFVAISWDQAINEISAKLSKVKEAYGSEALSIQAGSRTGVLNTVGAIRLFIRLWGTKNFSSSEPLCDLGKGMALDITQGNGMLPNVFSEDDIGQADVYLFIGDNQAETRPVNFGLLNNWRINNKAKMIVVDPRLTVTASKADDWLGIRSGTDMALGLALIYCLFDQNLHNEVFCDRWIEGWKVWRDFVIEKKYTAAWAEAITDIPADKINDLARTIAEADGCMIFLSRGINQHTNSLQTNRVFMFVAAMTGNWGRKGGGYFNVSSDTRWKPLEIPKEREPSVKPAVGINPVDWLDAMLESKPYPIKALITGNNPLAQWPNQSKVRKALTDLDLIVHMELFKNATSNYADYVLPMASGVEKGGPARFTEDRRFVWNDKMIDPPGDAKSDHWFWIELGKKFGFDDILKEEYKQPRKLWDEVIVAPTPYLKGADTSNLLKHKNRTVRVPIFEGGKDEIDSVYVTEKMQKETTANVSYETASGKLEFWTQKLEDEFLIMGMSSLPEFYSEEEQLINLPTIKRSEKAVVSPFYLRTSYAHGGEIISAKENATHNDYDTELVTGRPPAPHFHSWTHYFWQAQEMWPELYCQIHPSKAAKLNIKDGDHVMVVTKTSSIKARVWIHLGIRPTSVFMPIGWDESQPFHPAKGVNHLTGTKLDPIAQQANLKTHLCRVYKA